MNRARPTSPMFPAVRGHRMRRSWRALAFGALTMLAIAPAVRADELQDVSKLVAAGKLDQAEPKADAYLKNSPKDAQMRFLKGVILAQRGKRDDAVAVFGGLTQDYPELPEPYNNLAVIYAAQGQYDKARDALETAVRVSPNDATAHENLGDIYAALAARSYRDARRFDPSSAATLRKLDAARALLSGPAGAVPSSPVVPVAVAATPDVRSQRNVGLSQPATPSTLTSFGAEAPEIIVPSVGTVVPQGSNVVGVGTPDDAGAPTTSTLAGATTALPPDPVNPIPAITLAVQQWAASRSMKTAELNIRVDGDVAIARFHEDLPNARTRRALVRNHALTLRREGGEWAVTDDQTES
jgi:hypothetical protein